MDLSEWLLALLAIILVDLLLAGDNAVVIAMAARRLPAEMRKRAVFGGPPGRLLFAWRWRWWRWRCCRFAGWGWLAGCCWWLWRCA